MLEELIFRITNCRECIDFLPNGCRPVFSVSSNSKIVIIGQAPGLKVHNSGVPWADKSGENLRKWLGVTKDDFYDVQKFAIVPMGFCYPGKGKTGDLPPRKECAPLWHDKLVETIENVEMVLLIGNYAQKYYLQKNIKRNLTETVRAFEEFLPDYFVLPHPSPRNNIWMKKNAWFEKDVLPELKIRISKILNK